jgi:RNA-binding protein YhbY
MQATETEFNNQHRQKITATLNSNANGLKTFLFGFFTKFNLGAKIRTVDKYATLVEFEGPATLVMRAKEKLDVGLKEAFPGVIAEWEAALESTEIITKVTILETSEELKRCDSADNLREIDIMERDSVSGMTSFLEMFNSKNTDLLIFFARLVVLINTETVITINHRP